MRQYTTEYGHSVLEVYTSHLGAGTMRRDLRFKPQIEHVGDFNDIDVFNAIPMKDLWEDAELLGPLKYLMRSSRLRWG